MPSQKGCGGSLMSPKARRNWGVVALVSGIVVVILLFVTGEFVGCPPDCVMAMPFYPEGWTSQYVWIPLTVILGAVLFWGGLIMATFSPPSS